MALIHLHWPFLSARLDFYPCPPGHLLRFLFSIFFPYIGFCLVFRFISHFFNTGFSFFGEKWKKRMKKRFFFSILCVSFLRVQMIKSYEYGILDFFSYVFFQHPNGRYVFWTIMGKLNVLLICKILILQTSKNSHILAVSDEDGYVSLFDSRRRHPSFASYQENAGLFSLSNYILGFWLLLVHFYQSSLSFWWKLIILCAEKARLYEWVAHDNAVFDVCWIKVCTCHKDLLKICDVFWCAQLSQNY